jgi:RimJ/RimL family protein N-acetyltransferase
MRPEQILPAKIPSIRQMRPEDAELLASWIEQGRHDQFFRPGRTVNAWSVLRYQNRIRRSEWKYKCVVVEDGTAAIGYLDYKWRDHVGEILGIYLEPTRRAKHIGRHLIRWAVADLREQGCRRIRAEVYAYNTGSLLQTCPRAGPD